MGACLVWRLGEQYPGARPGARHGLANGQPPQTHSQPLGAHPGARPGVRPGGRFALSPEQPEERMPGVNHGSHRGARLGMGMRAHPYPPLAGRASCAERHGCLGSQKKKNYRASQSRQRNRSSLSGCRLPRLPRQWEVLRFRQCNSRPRPSPSMRSVRFPCNLMTRKTTSFYG